jgi:hypothetical protein
MVPGAMALISTSTGAPAALARSLGIKLITNGVAIPAAATPPAAEVAASNSRRLLRSTFSVMTSHPFIKNKKSHYPSLGILRIRAEQNLLWYAYLLLIVIADT